MTLATLLFVTIIVCVFYDFLIEWMEFSSHMVSISMAPACQKYHLQGLRLYSSESKGARGRLFLVDLKPSEGTDEPPKAVELKMKSKTLTPATFNPHGISAWISREGALAM